MTHHRRLQLSLYEYLTGEADAQLRREIESHLPECRKCAEELRELREATELLARPVNPPSASQGEEYWKSFSFAVEAKIMNRVPVRRGVRAGVLDVFREVVIYRRRSAALLAGGLAFGILLGIVAMKSARGPSSTNDSNVAATTETAEHLAGQAQAMPVIEVDRMNKYFRKSKLLLVGVENMHLGGEESLDLSVERNASRELLQEARYLKNQPLDTRSARLIGDLEKILIELATIKEEGGLQNVEIVRGGIHQENLLFKIRMAEALYDTTRFMKTRNYK